MMIKNWLKHHYLYDSSLVVEYDRSMADKNDEVYNALSAMAEKEGSPFIIEHFISDRSMGPDCLYDDFRVKGFPEPIRHNIDEVMRHRYLTPVKVSHDKGWEDTERIKQDLYAMRSSGTNRNA